jgi:hypothetical protein
MSTPPTTAPEEPAHPHQGEGSDPRPVLPCAPLTGINADRLLGTTAVASTDTEAPLPRRPGLALLLISTAQLMVVLDATIVNIALPSIQRALHFSPVNLEWVVNAYALAFGGLLLLGAASATSSAVAASSSLALSRSRPAPSPAGSPRVLRG